jgi:cellulose synthase/poly-beta-1,6-N-acetylglucosamine synthase-like glycosyltransferase
MNISVIIPAKNEEKYIETGLKCIKKSIENFKKYYPDKKVEIIVSDNVSKDNTKKIAKKYTDRIFETNSDSISGVRNNGAFKSKYDILVFIDADSQMHINTLKTIYELIRFTNIKAGCVKILPDKKIGLFYDIIIKSANYFFELFNTGSGLFFCRKQDFLKINGFNEKIYAAEDLDFVYRIKNHLNPLNFKFKNIHSIPIKTSMRKLEYVNKFHAIFKLIKFILFYKTMIYKKHEWNHIFYNTHKLR